MLNNDTITVGDRIRAQLYANTGYVPQEVGLHALLLQYSEAEVLAAWADYSSKRSTFSMADTVKSFFERGDGRAVMDALRMGLPMAQNNSGRPVSSPQLEEAMAWLQIALQDGAVMTKKLFDDAREGAGIRQETLRRACQALGIKPQKMAHGWVWALPSLAGASVEAAAPEDRVSCATSGERLGPKPTLLQSGSLHLC